MSTIETSSQSSPRRRWPLLRSLLRQSLLLRWNVSSRLSLKRNCCYREDVGFDPHQTCHSPCIPANFNLVPLRTWFETPAQVCSNGFSGIENFNTNGVACCALGCGICGGSGCGDRPGGIDACCINPIVQEGVSCAETSEAPCFIGELISSFNAVYIVLRIWGELKRVCWAKVLSPNRGFPDLSNDSEIVRTDYPRVYFEPPCPSQGLSQCVPLRKLCKMSST